MLSCFAGASLVTAASALCRGLALLVGMTGGVLGLSAANVTTDRMYLSGQDRDHTVPWEFRVSAGARAGEWSTLPVPSNWELHGFGTFSYHSETPAEEGDYRHRFVVPESWRSRRVFLVFDGAMTDTTVTLNGRSAGPTHRGGFYRFSYEVTDLVRVGEENLLEVHVEETSQDVSVNRAERTGDYWNFGGIFRPVWLDAVPANFIERVAIDARADGQFTVDVVINGAERPGTLVAQVTTLDGTPVGAPFSGERKAGGTVRLETKIDSPSLWSAETPNLYRVEIALHEGGNLVHQLRERFGFRTFEVRRGDGFYLNGQRIVLQGANRHSFHPESGRALAERDHREDIRLMREMNMNAVRMSHYPPDTRFLELCDELGLYVLNELAGWQKSYSEAAGRPLVASMVQRDVNHPSILFWDNGNEGGWQAALDADFAQWDPQRRPVLHPWDVLNGINTSHYRTFEQTVPMAQGLFPGLRRGNLPVTEPGPFIFMPTEFLHGLYDGGGGAGLEDYWGVMRTAPYPGGGFLWALVDEGVKRPDTGAIDVKGNQAPDGVLGPYREKEASFYTIKELWSPIVIHERALPAEFDGTLTLENRYGFTDAAACRFNWQLRRLPGADDRGFKTQILGEGVAAAPSVAPGASGALRLPLPANWREADVLALRVDDPHGNELWTWTWPLPESARLRVAGRGAGEGGAPKVTEGVNRLEIVAGSLTVAFDLTTGRLAAVRRVGQEFSFNNGPRPAVGTATLAGLEWRVVGNDVVIETRYGGALSSVTWCVRADGWIDCEFAYTAAQPEPALGVCFDFPADQVKAKRWVGAGPYRVWQNRLRGNSLGAWENDYNDTITGWSGWVYPEFKGCFAGVRWLTLDTTQGDVTVVVRTPELYVQVLTPSQPPEALRAATTLRLPEGGLSFLHVIPAIGTKFDVPEKLGPQSVLPPVRPEYRGAVSFRFGE